MATFEILEAVYNATGTTGPRAFRIGAVVGARVQTASTTSVLDETGAALVVGSEIRPVAETFGLVSVGNGLARPDAVVSIVPELVTSTAVGVGVVEASVVNLRGGHQLRTSWSPAQVQAALSEAA